MMIEILKGNILDQKVDVLVSPAHVSGYMGYGVAKAIVRAGGVKIENEAVEASPLIIGDAIFTTAGSLRFKGVIHTATIDDSNEKIESGLISKAILGALLLADDLGYKSVAVSGMGTGVGGVSFSDAAKAMHAPLHKFVPHSLERVVLVDLSDEMVDAWKKEFGVNE